MEALEVRRKIVEELRTMGIPSVVMGISGGKDSAVAAALCVEAFGKDKVFGLLLPDGEQKDISDSIEVCESLGIDYQIVNFGAAHQLLQQEINNYDRESDINMTARFRTLIIRYFTQLKGARMCGTGNASEIYVGYFTKFSDDACDFNPLANYTSVEVVEIGKTFSQLPDQVVNKIPTDGISGSVDEERLGVTYKAIHDVIRHGTSGDPDMDARIEQLHRNSAHKRNPIPKVAYYG